MSICSFAILPISKTLNPLNMYLFSFKLKKTKTFEYWLFSQLSESPASVPLCPPAESAEINQYDLADALIDTEKSHQEESLDPGCLSYQYHTGLPCLRGWHFNMCYSLLAEVCYWVGHCSVSWQEVFFFFFPPRFTHHTKGLACIRLLVPRRGFEKWPFHAACGGVWAGSRHGNGGSGRHDVGRRLGRLHRQRWLLHTGGPWHGDSCEPHGPLPYHLLILTAAPRRN